MRKIAVYLPKGGVGKTTTATQLAGSLAKKGRKVLLVDLDSQGHAALFLGVKMPVIQKEQRGIADVLLAVLNEEDVEASFIDNMVEARDNLFLLAGGQNISKAADAITLHRFERSSILSEALSPAVSHGFDYVILDIAPGWELITINALVYASELLSPIFLEIPSVLSLRGMIENLERITKSANKNLKINYLLPTRWDRRSKASKDILGVLEKNYPDAICNPIGSSVRFNEASGRGELITEFSPETRSAGEYEAFVDKVLSDEGVESVQP